jgi:primase-polymerase (primpol)-like protein
MVLGELNIPDTLAALDRWLLWRSVDGRKVPYKPGGHPARSTDPHDWTDVRTAYNALHKGGYAGLGFVFAEGDGLVGIDLDDCLDADGQVMRWAHLTVEHLNHTYAEISPSGTGLKFWCSGQITRALKTPEGDGAVEIYCKSRYFTFTGRRFNNAPLEVADCQDAIDVMYAALGTQREFTVQAFPSKFAHGTQHNNLVRICGALKRHNVCDDAIEACLQVVNQQQCEQPGPPENITQLVRSTGFWTAKED